MKITRIEALRDAAEITLVRNREIKAGRNPLRINPAISDQTTADAIQEYADAAGIDADTARRELTADAVRNGF